MTQSLVCTVTAPCWTLVAFSVSWSITHSVGLLGRMISQSQDRYLHTEQHKQNKCTYRHQCLKWNSSARYQLSSERRQFMPYRALPLWSAQLQVQVSHCWKLQAVNLLYILCVCPPAAISAPSDDPTQIRWTSQSVGAEPRVYVIWDETICQVRHQPSLSRSPILFSCFPSLWR
jgi:hypothetical protein